MALLDALETLGNALHFAGRALAAAPFSVLRFREFSRQLYHVLLGALQSERSPWLVGSMTLSLSTVLSLHLSAAFRERKIDESNLELGDTKFVAACSVEAIPERCAKVVSVRGERVAIFKYDGKISAISNLCRHQNGPLGEGRIIDGCVTCPWHGYQYAPESGAAPPPYTEKVSTFRTKLENGLVWLDPTPLPPGTYVEPTSVAKAQVLR